jgi:hypothetical protein
LVEDRTLLSSFVVNNTADSGPGSLRQAILDSNATTGQTNTIDFAVPGTGVQTIAPLSPLPPVTASVRIDGTSQPGSAGTPLIELTGSQAGSADGLLITGSDVTVRGLDITNFSQGAGIHITGSSATGNWIYGNFLGTDTTGTQALPNHEGVEIDAGATNNLIGTNGDGINDASERNLLSGNFFAGVWITGQGTSSNAVAGNWIGTGVSGEVALNNGTQPITDSQGFTFGGGVAISAGASGNRIGTDGKSVDDIGERNVIAGSDNDAIDIWGSGTDGNVVAGNFIGTDATATRALGIAGDGVFLAEGASYNWIGMNPNGRTAAADEGNAISGNGYDGIQFADSADSNVIAGNKIGTGATGTVALGNSDQGVEVDSGCVDTTIGGTAAGAGNMISANGSDAILIAGLGTYGNALVAGNRIGTDATGSVALGNAWWGIEIIDSGAVTVGGVAPGAGNVISGNHQGGVTVHGAQSVGDVVQGNLIGTDVTGTKPLGNAYHGVYVGDWGVPGDGASDALIGGATAGAGNVISGNGNDGIFFEGLGLDGNSVVAGNRIGTDATGSVALGNAWWGIEIIDSGAVTVGGVAPGAGNVISGNHQGGVTVHGAQSVGDVVQGNLIGTDVTGTKVLGNAYSGIYIGDWGVPGDAASDALIGGTIAGAGNVISANGNYGVWITGGGTTGNAVQGNWIGTDKTGTVSLGNAESGVEIDNGASSNTIGGATAQAGNLITSNGQFRINYINYTNNWGGWAGVEVGSSPTDNAFGNQITANRIFGNNGLAIGLGDEGFPGDSGPPGAGPNSLQNHPVIFTTTTGQLTGSLTGSSPDTTFRIDVYASARARAELAEGDGAAGGEAEGYLGSLDISTDSSGHAVFDIPYVAPAGLPVVTATATDPEGNTSEVSALREDSLQAPTAPLRLAPGEPQVFTGGSAAGFALSDPFAPPVDPAWTITLSVGSGTLVLSTLAGLLGTGNGTGTLVLEGTIPALNTALDGMTYTPAPGFQGTTILTFDAASGGALPIDGDVSIVVSSSIFRVTTTADSGPGSLRQAIIDSDLATGRTNTIDFAIPGVGLQTIAALTPLPAITTSVLIDGTTEPGFAGTPTIAIGSRSQRGLNALIVSNGDVTIRGLAIDGVKIDTTGGEDLFAVAHTQGSTAQLSLLDSRGTLLVHGNAVSSSDPDSVIDEGLAVGDYSLTLDGNANGGLTLTIMLTPASTPLQPIPTGGQARSIAAGDFSGNGRIDLAVANATSNDVLVLVGNGNGTFQPPVSYPVGLGPSAIVARDFTGDGHVDLAVVNSSSNDVSVLLGNGDNTFQPATQYTVGVSPDAIAVGDFTGNGRLDLAVASTLSSYVSVLLGNGDGTFQPEIKCAADYNLRSIVAGDFTGNGRLDLAVGYLFGGVGILLGNGDGTFRPPVWYDSGPFGITAMAEGDFSGNGKLDLAVVNDFDTVSVLMGNGDGTFQLPVSYGVGSQPSAIVAGDFTGDGRIDLAVANEFSDDVSILLGNGDGTFRPAVPYNAGGPPYGDGVYGFAIAAGEFTSTGKLDLAVANINGITILLDNGDGTFQASVQNAVGLDPRAMVAGDFTGNGRTDLAVVNTFSNDVSILLGNGDGTFQPAVQYPVGYYPVAIAAGDFNGDGRLDLAVADEGSNDVSILLGNGDGTFQPAVQYAVGPYPNAIVTGDFNGDGRVGLAVADEDGIQVLFGKGDGTFQPPVTVAAGLGGLLVTGDFASNGHMDLAVGEEFPSRVFILMCNGDGTFQPAVQYAVGGNGISGIVAGDFTGDGRVDLAVDEAFSHEVSVLLGNGDGTFQAPHEYASGVAYGYGMVAGDFGADGRLDLAVFGDSTTFAPEVSILLGNGGGAFQPGGQYPAPDGAALAADFTGDGLTDLAVTSYASDGVSILLNDGHATLVGAGEFATAPRAMPLVADVTGDGTNDMLVVSGTGEIVYRQGIPGQPGTFEPPVTVNPPLPDGSNPYKSRDIAWLPNTDKGPVLASVDAQNKSLTFYAYRDGGFVRLAGSLATGQIPAQIIAADLNGTGMTDVVVRNAGDGTLSVYFGTPPIPGSSSGPVNPQLAPPDFLPPVSLPVGIGVSDVQAVETTGNGRLDLLVTNKLSGQVSVLLNLGNGQFAAAVPYRAATGLSAIDASTTPELTSLEATAGVAAGPLTPGGPSDLVTINPGSETIDVLAGMGNGEFATPVTVHTQSPAQIVRMGDFTGSGIEDAAVLAAAGLSVYLGNGHGGFLPPTTYAVPPEADGLSVADLFGNGKLDLLVGDAYGDVFVLAGNGDGTFQPFHEASQTVELAVADLTGNGSKDIIYADRGLDRVVVDYGAGNSAVLGNQSTGLLAPGAVALADLNGDGIPDLIVANSGSNNVLIYPGLGKGQFGQAVNGGHGYFVGTNPVGITVADLTGNLPDLVVADKGSNQVSILLNQGDFRFTDGPRLNAGGDGPVSTIVGHFTGSPYPDILVTNSQSNDVALLPGVGGGFFKDTNPQTFPVGNTPGPTFVGTFDGKLDLVTVNSGSNDLTLISGFLSADSVTHTVASGGVDPAAAFSFEAASGFEDLVVGNAGDGILALFEGSASGLSLSATETIASLPSPTALVYAGLGAGEVQFYAATEGRESAILVALSLGGEFAPVSTSFTLTVEPSLVSLQENSLQLVGTLVVVTIESSANGANFGLAEIEAATALSGSAAQGLGQSALPANQFGESVSGWDEQSAKPPQPEPLPSTSWQRFLLGTDESIEKFSRDNPAPSQSRSDQAPQTIPTGKRSESGPSTVPSQDVPPKQSTSGRGTRQSDTIDRAIERMNDDARALESGDQGSVRATHRVFRDIEIGLVGLTQPTIGVDNGHVRGIRRSQDEVTLKVIGWTLPQFQTRVAPEKGYDRAAALALAATVARGGYVPVLDRRARMHGYLARRHRV